MPGEHPRLKHEADSMKKKGVLQVRLDVDDLEKLKKEAKDTGHSLSSLARYVLMEYLRYKQGKDKFLS